MHIPLLLILVSLFLLEASSSPMKPDRPKSQPKGKDGRYDDTYDNNAFGILSPVTPLSGERPGHQAHYYAARLSGL